MKNLELEEMGLLPITKSEMVNLEGGILVGLFNIVAEAAKFIVSESADFVQGAKDGFNKYVN
jgi:hypothetical protein